MKMVRQVIVFDAADLHAESAFWAGILGGHVFEDDDWHSVIDAAGEWQTSPRVPYPGFLDRYSIAARSAALRPRER